MRSASLLVIKIWPFIQKSSKTAAVDAEANSQSTHSWPKRERQATQTRLGMYSRPTSFFCLWYIKYPLEHVVMEVTCLYWSMGFSSFLEHFQVDIKIQITIPSSSRALDMPCNCCEGTRSPHVCHVFKKSSFEDISNKCCATWKETSHKTTEIAFAKFTSRTTMLHLPH
jgi:hypothetical protein